LIRHTWARHEWRSEYPEQHDDKLDNGRINFAEDETAEGVCTFDPSSRDRLSATKIVLGKVIFPPAGYEPKVQFERRSLTSSSNTKGSKEHARPVKNKCSICGFMEQKSALAEHTQAEHARKLVHPSKKLYVCNRCPWSTLAPDNAPLREHNAVVHGVKPQRDICGKANYKNQSSSQILQQLSDGDA